MAQPKRIAQETFDAVVRENIEEFEMELEEAIADAKQQFETQGVDLSNLITTYIREEGGERLVTLKHCHPVKDALDAIKEHSSENGEQEKLTQAFIKFDKECTTESNRKFAASHRGLPILLYACRNIESNDDLLVKGLSAFSTFINGQPHVIDRPAIDFLFQCLKDFGKHRDDVLEMSLKCLRYSCIKSESNRQTFVQLGVIPLVIEILQSYRQSPVIQEACAVVRILTFDDDMSVAFGKAHENAKQIVANNAITVMMVILKVHSDNVDVVSNLCATLGRLFVRDEFCKEFADMGGLMVMLNMLEEKIEHQAIVKQVFAVLRALAGNDDVKAAIVEKQGVVLIIAAMTRHAKQAYLAEQGCAALACIALRMPSNCTAIVAAGGLEAILKAMQIHSDVVAVQKQGCLALRNLVARNSENCEVTLGAGAESLVRFAYSRYPECRDLAKAALRDLGCEVELRELWTGAGKGL